MKEFILTILRKFAEQEVGLIKGSEKREIWKGKDFIQVGQTGSTKIISLSLLCQALQTTQNRDLGYISTRLQFIIRDTLETLKRAYELDRFLTVPELERWFKYSGSTGRLNRIIIQSCNGNVELLGSLYSYLESVPFYWDDIIDVDEAIRIINEQIELTSSPAISELKQLRVA